MVEHAGAEAKAEIVARARAAFGSRDWSAARAGFNAAPDAELSGDDLYALAEAAWWLGAIDESLAAFAGAHRWYSEAGLPRRAAMAGMFLAAHSLERGESAIGSAWISRVRRHLEEQPDDAEHGYPLYFDAFEAMADGRIEDAVAIAAQMQEVGRRFGDHNLAALATLVEGRALVKLGDASQGMRLLDEAMLLALGNELHPVWTGAIYCHLMDACHELLDLRRAAEWTQAAARWCESLQEAWLYRGICRVHRAQVLQLQGEWVAAESAATQACEDLLAVHVHAAAEAQYELGEIHRMRGDLASAEASYRAAHELGRDPRPGLALLRLAQGRTKAALGSISSALVAKGVDRLARARLLAAQVEIAGGAGDLDLARAACEELEQTAAVYGSSGLRATASNARGLLQLAAGLTDEALPTLRAACRLWQELDAPYNAAKVRLLLSQAYFTRGDDDAAALELDAAAVVFERLGAVGEHDQVSRLRGKPTFPDGLTEREAEVLRLVAVGHTNREIAALLVLSEKTAARHLANIFAKIGVSSRAAAASYAYEHGLVTPAGG